jgi:glutathione S-transferase
VSGVYRLVGSTGSPYSMKLRAAMRYRRIPHVWVLRTPAARAETAHVRPQVIPMLRLPEGEWRVDSTPILQVLERRHPERSLLPTDPASRFIALLLEDFADEWLAKAMFHYRWAYPETARYAALWIAHDEQPGLSAAEYAARAEHWRERQTSRMPLVGCTAENAPVIEESYLRTLDLLKEGLAPGRYLFGARPSVADFALFGQLKTLADDPEPMRIMRARAQVVADWLRQNDDASGVEGEWGAPSPAVRGLLRLCAETYLPFLAANADALARGADRVELEIWGSPWSQAPFRYQEKCLTALRLSLASEAEPLLRETGCWRWLAG